MNNNEPLAQLLEETRQTNRLLRRQLTWSRILAVVLAVIAGYAEMVDACVATGAIALGLTTYGIL